MKKYLGQFIREEDGADIVEYIGLIALAAALIAGLSAIIRQIKQAAETKTKDAVNEMDKLNGGGGGIFG